jgi:hypothetical protein
MKRVIVESPYGGEVELNEAYGELALHDCLLNYQETPYASHLLYTRKFVLDDNNVLDRVLGINAGFAWREVCDKTVFYIDLGISSGMRKGMEDCEKKNLFYETRMLPDYLWERLKEYAESIGITIT